MTSSATIYQIREDQPSEVVRVEIDAHADMHAPDQPYRLTLWEPEGNVQDDETPHACRNLSRTQLTMLHRAIGNLLDGES